MTSLAEKKSSRLAEVEEFFATSLNVVVPSVDEDLIEAGLLDSLLLVELILILESNYGISVDIEDLEFDNFRSIASVCDFIDRNSGD